jgi:hypothetical protein
MLQESSFARQTRRPIFSLEAVRSRQIVFAQLPVILLTVEITGPPEVE